MDNFTPTIILINATSLVKNGAISYLGSEVLANAADCAIVTETWMNSKHLNCLFNIDGFSLHRRDRTGRKGGGVAIFTPITYSATLIKTPSHALSNFEILWVKFTVLSNQYFLCGIYHPPKPVYSVEAFQAILTADIDFIMQDSFNPTIIIGGDFNSFNCEFLTVDLGLFYLTTGPTHGPNTLDKFFVSNPDLFYANTQKSLLKTKHMLVCIKSTLHNINTDSHCFSTNKQSILYDFNPLYVSTLRLQLASINWFKISTGQHPTLDQYYSDFVKVISSAVDHCIPRKTITLRKGDPSFVTPLVKSLLTKRCKLRMQGRLIEANNINEQINALINNNNKTTFSNLVDASPKRLWASVNKNAPKSLQPINKLSPEIFNNYFSNNSFSSACPSQFYTSPSGVLSLSNATTVPANYDELLPYYTIEQWLSKVKTKSPGPESIPTWVWKLCSFELAKPVSYIFASSLHTATTPSSWSKAIVTPIPKIDNPSSMSDYRPISVTPVLSRLLERIVVQKFIYPSINNSMLADQFAFRPSGSTTAALVTLTHHVSHLLETNAYVRCLLIDFSKAFDVVDRFILISKLRNLNLAPCILNWIINFLSNRTQAVKIDNAVSSFLPINMGVIQGSALGPSLFSIMLSDLRPLSLSNVYFKYADDTNLLVPEKSDVSLTLEFDNLKIWAKNNKLPINFSKTKELVFHRPSPRQLLQPPPLDSVERLSVAKLLGVTLADDLRFNIHVNNILSICNQRMYLLKSLKSRGLSSSNLNTVFNAIIISRLLYALPAWAGYVTHHDIARINSLLSKCFKFGYASATRKFTELMHESDLALFKKIQSPLHCLHFLLPPTKLTPISTRPKGHNFVLPHIKYDLYKRSFIVRSLFNFI